MVNNRVKDVLESIATWSKEEKDLLLTDVSHFVLESKIVH